MLHQPPPLSRATLLADAADVLASHAEYGAPVLDESGGLVGWLDHTVLLRALSGSTRPQAHAPSVPHPEPAAP